MDRPDPAGIPQQARLRSHPLPAGFDRPDRGGPGHEPALPARLARNHQRCVHRKPLPGSPQAPEPERPATVRRGRRTRRTDLGLMPCRSAQGARLGGCPAGGILAKTPEHVARQRNLLRRPHLRQTHRGCGILHKLAALAGWPLLPQATGRQRPRRGAQPLHLPHLYTQPGRGGAPGQRLPCRHAHQSERGLVAHGTAIHRLSLPLLAPAAKGEVCRRCLFLLRG